MPSTQHNLLATVCRPTSTTT